MAKQNFPFEEPEVGDAVRVRYIDMNDYPVEAKGEVQRKEMWDDGDYVFVLDSGFTEYTVSFYQEENCAQVDGYGPASEIQVIS